MIKIEVVGLDENGDYSSTYTITDAKVRWLPCKYSISVDRTAGTTNVVSVALLGKWAHQDVWEALCTVAASDTEAAVHGPSVDWGEPDYHYNKSFDTYRIYATTVGAGNTLTATAILYNPYIIGT
jgi:hypothetical protein